MGINGLFRSTRVLGLDLSNELEQETGSVESTASADPRGSVESGSGVVHEIGRPRK